MTRDYDEYEPADRYWHRRPARQPDDEMLGIDDVRRRAAHDYADRFGTGRRSRDWQQESMPEAFGTARDPQVFDRGYRSRPDGRYGERYGVDEPRLAARSRARGYRGRGPKNYTRSDERIREDLNERLWDADDVDASDVTVEVGDGVVTLRGNVEERWVRHRIEDIAADCAGVRDIQNEVRVQPRNEWPDDKGVAAGSIGGTSGRSEGPGKNGGMVQSALDEAPPRR